MRELKKVAGVEQISYSGNSFRSKVRFELTPTGRALGFDESEISSQIRAQLDGLEATRLTRGVNEVRVMIRGSQSNQRTLPDLSGLILISNSGQHAVLGDLQPSTGLTITGSNDSGDNPLSSNIWHVFREPVCHARVGACNRKV